MRLSSLSSSSFFNSKSYRFRHILSDWVTAQVKYTAISAVRLTSAVRGFVCAMKFSFVPWSFRLCRESFCLWHEGFICTMRVFVCAVKFSFVPWHFWATIINSHVIQYSAQENPSVCREGLQKSPTFLTVSCNFVLSGSNKCFAIRDYIQVQYMYLRCNKL